MKKAPADGIVKKKYAPNLRVRQALRKPIPDSPPDVLSLLIRPHRRDQGKWFAASSLRIFLSSIRCLMSSSLARRCFERISRQICQRGVGSLM